MKSIVGSFRRALILKAAGFLVLLLSAGFSSTYGQTTQTFNSSDTWTAPAGVTTVTVECWGGGGAGGGNNHTSNGAGGGGGGGYSRSVLTVIPSTIYTVTVGAGGIGVAGATGNPGDDTWFNSSVTILAKGGSGGVGVASGGSAGSGGTGGQATSGVGTTKFNGGNGGNGRSNANGPGGGGGSSAGTAANGNTGINGSGTTGGNGGAAVAGGGGGGRGGDAGGSANIAVGTSPGGGGGGAGDKAASGDASISGTSGANGQVIVTYTVPTVTNFSPSSMCAGGSTSVIITGTNFSSATAVTFNGVSASYVVNNATQITATVPVGATTGAVSVTAGGNTGTSGSSFTINSDVLPSVSNFSASGATTCTGSGAVVTVSSTTLTSGTYTVTYNVSGTNTVSSTTANMTFTAGSPGTGTFTTAALNSAASNNVVNITAIAFSTSTTCTSALSTSTAVFNTDATSNVSNFSAVGAQTVVGDKAVVTITSSTLTNGTTYTVTYSVSGTNTVASSTSSMTFGAGSGTFETAILNNAGTNNTVTITSVKVTGSSCAASLNYSTATFTTVSPDNCQSFNGGGNWNTANSWTNCGGGIPTGIDNATITSGNPISLVNSESVHNLTVASNGSLSNQTGNGSLQVSGDFTLYGTISGDATYTLTGSDKNLDGTGNVTNSQTITVTGNKTILSTANMYLTGSLAINGAYTITNNGTITIGGNVTGTSTSSVWTNATNSTLNSGASTSPIFTTSSSGTINGTLNASATGNTVNYYGASSSYFLTTPSTVSGYPTYYHLSIAGSGTKNLPNTEIAIDGDLTLNGSGDLSGNGSSRKIRLRGDWIDEVSTNAFTESGSSAGSTVTFDGTGDQYISKSGTNLETFHNFVVNKSSGTLYLSSDVKVGANAAVSSTLTMTSGNINTGSNTLTLGRGINSGTQYTGILVHTSGTIIGEFERYIQDATYPASTDSPAGSILFPVGTTSYYRPASVTSTSITAGLLTGKFVSGFPGNTGLPQTDADAVVSYNAFRDGYWSLTTANTFASSNFSLSLTGTAFTGFPTIDNNTRLLTRANSSSSWAFDGSHVTYSAGNVIQRSGMSQLGEYALGDDTNCTTPAAPPFTGASSVCTSTADSPYTLDTYTASSTYTWTIVGSTSVINTGTNAVNGSESIEVDWDSNASVGSVTVYETNVAGCSGPDSTLSVIIQTVPPSSLTGNDDVPQNSDDLKSHQQYIADNSSYYTGYTWTVTGGMIVDNSIEYSTLTTTSNSIYVRWNDAGSGTVCVQGITSCGTSVESTCMDVNIYNLIYSVAGGSWSANGTWSCGCTPTASDNVFVKSSHAVTIPTGGVTVKNLIVSGSLVGSGGSNKTLTITGNLTLNGNGVTTGVIGGGAHAVNLNAGISSNLTIDGTGAITNSVALNINANRTILSSATISKSTGAVTLASGVSVTNNGTITFGGNITGADATSTWTNAAASTLNAGGTLLSTGTLEASATDNTVHYNSSTTTQAIKSPSSSYYNLHFSGTTEKTAPSALTVAGNFINDGTATTGTWVGFNPNAGTVTFPGTSTLSGSATTSFNNLIVSGTVNSPSINVAGNFTNNGTFNHNSGTVNFNGATIVGGTPVTSPTAFNNISLNGTSLTFPSATINVAGNITFTTGAFSHGNGTIDLNGTGIQTLTVNNATFNNVTTTNKITNTASLASNMTVAGTLLLTSGNFALNANTLTLNGTFSSAGGSNQYLSSTSNSTLSIGGSGNFGTLYFLPSTGNTVGTLTVNRTASGNQISLGNAVTVSSTLNLTKGDLENPATFGRLTMGSGSIINRKPEGAFATGSDIPSGGPYDVVYSDGSANGLTTGIEILGSGLRHVTSSLSGTSLLNAPMTGTGALTVSSGTWTSSGNAISMASFSNSGIFNAPSSTFTLTGNFANNLTFNANSGKVIFNGVTQSIGSVPTTFYDVTINNTSSVSTATSITSGNLFLNDGSFSPGANTVTLKDLTNNGTFNAPTSSMTTSGNWVNTGTFNHNNGTANFNGTTTISGTGASDFYNLTQTGNVTLARAVSVMSNLTLTSGVFTNPSSFLTMGDGATLTRTSGSITAAPLTGMPPIGNSYNLNYNGTSLSTSFEALGTHIKNVGVNVSGTLTQATNLNLYGVLSVNSGTYAQDIDERLVVKSTSDTTGGSIGPILGTFSSANKIKVERYMGAEGSVNRYISSPVTGATLTDLVSGFAIVRNIAQYYDETIMGNKDTKGFKTTGAGITLVSGKGYLIFPTPTYAGTNITWDVSGPLTIGSNQNDVDLKPKYTVSIPAFLNQDLHDGWNLMGNPYPSGIQWTDDPAKWTMTNIDSIVYVTNMGDGVFMTYDFNTNLGTLPGGIIASGQAFWVKATGPSPALIVHEAAKSSASSEFFRRSTKPVNGLEVSLAKGLAKDVSWLLLNPSATVGVDKKYDRIKWEGELMSVSFDAGNETLLMYSVINEVGNNQIPLNVKTMEPGTFTLKFDRVGIMPEYDDLYLVDKKLGNLQKINEGSYVFTTKGNEQMRDRFYLTAKPGDNSPGSDPIISVFPNPMMETLEVKAISSTRSSAAIVDINGALIVEKEMVSTAEGVQKAVFDVRQLNQGVYLVRTLVDGKMVIKKVVKL